MTVFAHGWVETYDASDDVWDAVIRVDQTPDGNLYSALFGVRSIPDDHGLVGHRGFPANACEFTKLDFNQGGPWRAPTWATQNELGSITNLTVYEDWHMLLELMTVLARYHSPEHVRLVIWFG